jgi:phosphoribosylglycinamide formyltransferase-1
LDAGEPGLRIGVLASGRGTNLEAVLEACERGEIPGRVVVVLSDRKEALALERARRRGIPAIHVSPRSFASREEYDLRLAELLRQHEVDLVVLAGYLRYLTPPFVEAFRHRAINIHPSLLPAFPGLEAQRQALEYGVKVSGCTVHFIDEELDHGPIILQAAVPVREDDDVASLSERILREEHRIPVEAVRLFAEGRLRVEGRRVRILERPAVCGGEAAR